MHSVFQRTHSSSGLYTAKLKTEHLKLTSYSKMRVDLAAQVYSNCYLFVTIIIIPFNQYITNIHYSGTQ